METPIANRKLGLNPSRPRDLIRALYMPKYFRALPPPPPACDLTSGIPDAGWGMMGNDQWGDCVVAGGGHRIQAWTIAESGAALRIPDANILSVYHQLSPGDNGLNIADFLKWLQKRGLVDGGGRAHSIGPYGGLDPSDPEQIKQAIYLFGAVCLGIELPSSWFNNAAAGFIWDATNSGIVGGHDVELVGYDQEGFHVISWGVKGTLTPRGLAQRCFESWTMLSPDWYLDGKSPSGLDKEALAYDLAIVTGAEPPPPPPPEPPPPPPPEPPRPWWWPCRKVFVYAARSILLADARCFERARR